MAAANDFHAGPVTVTMLSPTNMQNLQQFLLDMGYNPGEIDGNWGPKTKAAWELFASTHELPTDTVDGRLWHAVAGGGERDMYTVGEFVDQPVYDDPNAPATSGAGDGVLDQEEIDRVKELYPTLAHLLDDQEIYDLLVRAVEEGLDGAAFNFALEATNWFKTTTASQRTFDASINRDPASAQKRIDEQRLTLQTLFETYGVRVSEEELDEMSFDIVRNGTNEQGVLRLVGDRVRSTLSGDTQDDSFGGDASGRLAAITQQLSSMARAFHLGFAPDTIEEWAVRITEGRWSYEAAEAVMRRQAAESYPALRDDIMQGMTVEDYFAPTVNRLAQILEINPNQVNLLDDKWSKFTQMVDDGTGPRQMNYAELGREARQMDEYWATDTASEQGYGMMNNLLQTFGVI